MEEQQLVVWGPSGPAMVYSSVMERFGLKQRTGKIPYR